MPPPRSHRACDGARLLGIHRHAGAGWQALAGDESDDEVIGRGQKVMLAHRDAPHRAAHKAHCDHESHAVRIIATPRRRAMSSTQWAHRANKGRATRYCAAFLLVFVTTGAAWLLVIGTSV